MASGAIVVTGSAGLIGFGVAARLAQEGRAVIGTDRIQPREDGGFPSTDAELTDVHKLHAICSGDISAIVHCGAVSGPMLGRDNPRAVIETNVAGTANLLEIARQRGVRLVFCSSTSAYGDTATGLDPVPEDAPLAANDIYGATKASGRHPHPRLRRPDRPRRHRAALLLGLRAAPPHPLRGARDDQGRAGRPQPPVSLYGRGFTRQYVYIDDVVSAVIAALDAGEIGPQRAFNVTGGQRLEFGAIAEAVEPGRAGGADRAWRGRGPRGPEPRSASTSRPPRTPSAGNRKSRSPTACGTTPAGSPGTRYRNPRKGRIAMPRAAVIVPFPFDEEGLDYRRAEMEQVQLSGPGRLRLQAPQGGPEALHRPPRRDAGRVRDLRGGHRARRGGLRRHHGQHAERFRRARAARGPRHPRRLQRQVVAPLRAHPRHPPSA